MDHQILDDQYNSNADECTTETSKEQMVESVINKWLQLQKTIKEEITLEDVIIRHQENEFVQLKDYFNHYYLEKLKSREIIEEIKMIQKNKRGKIKESVVERGLEHIFLDICEPIKNLLFLFRNNYDYIITLVSLINEYDEDDKISSLVELFCNQFYENILIPNPEQEELLLLVYKLLEKEIAPMNSASLDEFLNEDTFLGKFITSFMERQELKVFLSTLLNPFILDIENNTSGNYFGMSLFAIKDYLKEINIEEESKKINLNNLDFNDCDESEMSILKNIPKTAITFKKRRKMKKNEEGEDKNKKINEEEEEEDEDNDSDEEYDGETTENSNENNDNKNNINEDYERMLDLDFLDDKINKEENEMIKNFYLYEMEQITSDLEIYSNISLLEIMKDKDFQENKSQIVIKYKENFLFIKNKIDTLIQSLINKIEIIPYTIRCICKIISLLLQEKFPFLFVYLRNSFLGKFFFDKCIIPVLNLHNKNVLEPRILSPNTKNCLNEIIMILQNAYKCQLFDYNLDTEKTIFNHYLLEIIPLLNKFYEKLIDIDLPPILEKLFNKTKLNIEENIDNKIHNFRTKKKNTQTKNEIKKNQNNNQKGKELLYDYFQIHNDELLHLQCICFSLDDIMFILSLIGRNIRAFSHLPEYTFFKRTYDFIQPSDYKLDQENSKDPEVKKFFIIFKDEKSAKIEKFTKKNKKSTSTFVSEEADSDLINKRFKSCIKTVLKGLNLLNSKDYAHLNMAVTTRKFFSALKYTLDDFGELSEIKNIIPLKWYGQYIFNNIDGLDNKYKNDDYAKVYDDIYNEELSILNELKSLISLIITRDGMNARYAQKILQKTKYDLNQIKKIKDYVKIEKFIEEEEIEVCIQTPEIILPKEKDKKKKQNKNKKELENKNPILITDDLNCLHKSTKNRDFSDEKQNPYHCYSIKDFISKFSNSPWKQDEKGPNYMTPQSLVLADIEHGNRSNKIYESLSTYMNIIKKHILNQKKNKEIFDTENVTNIEEIIKTIKDYLMNQLYIHAYPKDQIINDKIFHQQTQKLSWVTPENLNIKKIYINQLANAVSWIKKIDIVKSIKDKLLCVQSAINTMNNTIKFSLGIQKDPEKDELIPIFHYIIIKAQPKRMYSNINYIECFLEESELNSVPGALLEQMKSAANFILNIKYNQLNVSEEEFNNNINNSFYGKLHNK